MGAVCKEASPAQVARVWAKLEDWIPVGKVDVRRWLRQIAPGWKDPIPGLPGRCLHLWEGTCVCSSFPVLGMAAIESHPEVLAASQNCHCVTTPACPPLSIFQHGWFRQLGL